jgi:hypothetical protein
MVIHQRQEHGAICLKEISLGWRWRGFCRRRVRFSGCHTGWIRRILHDQFRTIRLSLCFTGRQGCCRGRLCQGSLGRSAFRRLICVGGLSSRRRQESRACQPNAQQCTANQRDQSCPPVASRMSWRSKSILLAGWSHAFPPHTGWFPMAGCFPQCKKHSRNMDEKQPAIVSGILIHISAGLRSK